MFIFTGELCRNWFEQHLVDLSASNLKLNIWLASIKKL